MSLWRWILISDFRKLALVSVCLCASSWVARGNDSPPAYSTAGATSPEEGALLWKDAQVDFGRGLDEEAIPKLERFVARYPGFTGYLDAHRMLGRAYLRSGQPAKARPLLKAFVQARGKTVSALEARLELSRADLELGKHSEALLTANETIQIAASRELRGIRAEALLARARAQLGLGQDKRASASADAALSTAPPPRPPRLLGQAKDLQLRISIAKCARFPSKGKLGEAQVRDQLSRRGTCLLHALLGYREVLQADHAPASESATEQVTQAYASYWDKCRNPPLPPPIHPKDRNENQLKTYFRELSVVLEESCRQNIRKGRELLAGWETTLSPRSSDSLKKASAHLEILK